MKKTITFLLAILGMVISLQAQIPTDGLVAYYPFNGDANDESGNANNGIISGAVVSEDRLGNQSSAYYFDGIDDYIKIAGALPITNSFTISFWAYCESNTGYHNIICDGSSNAGGADFLINFRDNNIGIRADKGVPLNYEDSSPAELSNLDIINKWVHVVWVMNPTSSLVYLNNNLLTTINEAGTNEGYHDAYSFIGARQVWGSPDYFFQGYLDDIRIYDRPLIQEEIQSLYNDDENCPCWNGCIVYDTTFVTIYDTVKVLLYDTITNLNNEIQYIKFESYYSADDGQVNVYEIQAYSESVNIALNKPVYVNSGGGASSAVDGQEYSRWEGNRSDAGPDSLNPHFIIVDLQNITPIDSIILNIKGFDSWAQIFDLSVSSDSINWYSIGKGDSITGIFTYFPENNNSETIYDTVYITVNDTVFTAVNDTTYVTIADTIAVTDTLIIDAVLTDIAIPFNTNRLKVYPNPAKDHVFINTGQYGLMMGYKLRIINQKGATVFETSVEEPLYEVNLSKWTGVGLYYFQIFDCYGNIIDIRKIVLQ